jgi:nucleotide-binding universal stress UspA family protein
MKNILLPTDFSSTSFHAATFALDLFGTSGMRYTLLNTYLKPAYRNFLMGVNVDTERASRNGLRRMERRCRQHAPGVRLSLKSGFGTLEQEIGTLHQEGRADLVVLGTQGEGNYGLVGHNTKAVITGADVPVVAVPAQWKPGKLKRILLADDGLGLNARTLAPLVSLAKLAKAHVEVVHIRDERDRSGSSDRQAILRLLLEGVSHGFTMRTDNNVEEALDALALEQDVQLVTVVRRQRGLIERLFQGSHSKRMAMHTSVPLLVLHERP